MCISYAANLKELKTHILLKIGARKSPGGNIFLHLFHTLHSILPGGPFVNCCAVDSDTFFQVISAHPEYPPSPNIALIVMLENVIHHFLVEFVGPCLCCVLFCLHLCCGSPHLVTTYLCFSLCNGLWAPVRAQGVGGCAFSSPCPQYTEWCQEETECSISAWRYSTQAFRCSINDCGW